jgi:hypothetical protein
MRRSRFFCHSCGRTWIIAPALSVRWLIEHDFSA